MRPATRTPPSKTNEPSRVDPEALDRAWRSIRRRSLAAIAVVTALVALLTTTVAFYAFPADDPVSAAAPADVVYVIGPATPARLAAAERLHAEGIAPAILVSVYRAGTAAPSPAICAKSYVTCEIADPATTKGEALMLSRYAAQHPARSVVVLTMTTHVPRTRYVFDRCFDGRTSVVAVPGIGGMQQWVKQIAYQSAAFVKAWATPCASEG